MNLTPSLATVMHLSAQQQGVLVQSVEQDSSADRSGLRGSYKTATVDGQDVLVGGDVITAVNGQPVATVQDLQAGLRSAGFGATVTLTILRDGQQQQVTAQLPQSGAATPTP
jgi:S1-C subfamily serine protease